MRFELRVLALLTALSTGGTLAAPLLHDRPLLLMAMSPRLIFVALAAVHTPLPLFMIVGLIRLTVADPINYAIGRRLGAQACANRLINRLPNSQPLAAVLVVIRPTGLIMAYAGSIGLRGRLVATLDLIGTAVYLFALHAGVHRLFA